MNTMEKRHSAAKRTVFSRFHLSRSPIPFLFPFRSERKAEEALEGIEIFPRPICSLLLASRRHTPPPPTKRRDILLHKETDHFN